MAGQPATASLPASQAARLQVPGGKSALANKADARSKTTRSDPSQMQFKLMGFSERSPSSSWSAPAGVFNSALVPAHTKLILVHQLLSFACIFSTFLLSS